MRLLIDDANIEKIKRIWDVYPIDGVTTNPSILAKTGRPAYEVLKEIRAFIGDEAELHVQVISTDSAVMIEEAHKMAEILGKNTYIKIPSIPEGFKAMKALSREGYKITATAIYTPMQAYLAAKSGADYAAPYINRIDDLGFNGIDVAILIQKIFTNNGYKTKLLAASFKNSLQVQELCVYGIGAATIAPEVIEGLVNNPTITSAVSKFVSDFEHLSGEGTLMLNYDE